MDQRGRLLRAAVGFAGRSLLSYDPRRSAMRMHLALLLAVAVVFALSPLDGVAEEKQIADVQSGDNSRPRTLPAGSEAVPSLPSEK